MKKKPSVQITQKVIATINTGKISKIMDNVFNLPDIKELTFDLQVDYDNLRGENKKIKIRELVQQCANEERIQELWDSCNERRPKANWKSTLEMVEPSPIKQSRKRSSWLIVGVLIGLFVGGLAGWLVRNARDTPTNTTNNDIIFNFENRSELAHWIIKLDDQRLTPERTIDLAFTGNYSLQINTNLKSPDIQGGEQKEPIPQILLSTTEDLKNKFVIYRIYAPSNTPDNLAAQLFLQTDNENIWGTYTHLTPGKWTSLSWIPTLSASQIGIEIKMDDIATDNSQATYNGPVYIDQVEILDVNTITE